MNERERVNQASFQLHRARQTANDGPERRSGSTASPGRARGPRYTRPP